MWVGGLRRCGGVGLCDGELVAEAGVAGQGLVGEHGVGWDGGTKDAGMLGGIGGKGSDGLRSSEGWTDWLGMRHGPS